MLIGLYVTHVVWLRRVLHEYSMGVISKNTEKFPNKLSKISEYVWPTYGNTMNLTISANKKKPEKIFSDLENAKINRLCWSSWTSTNLLFK